jgi:predicted adenine nucleotide alpha hydrolase (AANH) superfamily ATPase
VSVEKILLHQCCAPCSYKVIELLAPQFSIFGFWYNPNIHPESEYDNRSDALLKLNDSCGITTSTFLSLTEEQWTEKAPKTIPERCYYCYAMRLNKTAEQAKSRGFKSFTTTLLISPFQKHELVKEAGMAAAKANGVEFYYQDMRQHYYDSKNAARDAGFYIQKYCGCSFSKVEREAEKQAKRNAKNI